MNTLNCEQCRLELIKEKLLPSDNKSYCLKTREKDLLKTLYNIWILKSDISLELKTKITECYNNIIRENKCDFLLCIEPGYQEINENYKYTFQMKLGEGSFGEVWKAISKNLTTNESEYVAIKTFKRMSEQGRRELLRELQCLRNIESICKEYGVCLKNFYETLDGKARLVIKYIEGRNLNYLNIQKTLEERKQYKNFIYDLSIGLDTIHNLQISHQDIKPENIIYDEDKEIFRYLDWGLCCGDKDIQGYGSLKYCGSPGTMYTVSPEIFQKYYDVNTKKFMEQIKYLDFDEMVAHDIWSLGIVFLRFLTNTQEENKKYDEYFKFSRNQIWNLVKPERTGDPEISDIIFQMLEQDPTKRIENFDYIIIKLVEDKEEEERLKNEENMKSMEVDENTTDVNMTRDEIVYGRMDPSLLTNEPEPDPLNSRSMIRCGNNSSCRNIEEMSIN